MRRIALTYWRRIDVIEQTFQVTPEIIAFMNRDQYTILKSFGHIFFLIDSMVSHNLDSHVELIFAAKNYDGD